MLVEVVSWLSLVTRTAVRASATVVATGADGSVRERSEHVLEAEDLLRWSYVAFGDGDEVHQSCDGVELVQAAHGRSTRTRVAGGPEFFSSWPGVVDAWLVEMLRPVDLLARVAVSSITGDRLVRMTATPLGNEPSPYNGFSIPDGRTLAMSLDMERGCFTGAAVTRPGCDALTFTVTHVE